MIECDKLVISNEQSGVSTEAFTENEAFTASETVPTETAPAETTEAPLWQRVGDMFPEVKPQQSMAAWDDEPF